jgi:hypothetical protein
MLLLLLRHKQTMAQEALTPWQQLSTINMKPKTAYDDKRTHGTLSAHRLWLPQAIIQAVLSTSIVPSQPTHPRHTGS